MTSGRAARVVFLVGAAAVGVFLWRSSPREVVLVYAVEDPAARALEVDIRRGAEVVRRAEFRLPAATGGPRQVRHEVRLPDGDYLLQLTVRDGEARRAERTVTVTESGSIVIPIGR